MHSNEILEKARNHNSWSLYVNVICTMVNQRNQRTIFHLQYFIFHMQNFRIILSLSLHGCHKVFFVFRTFISFYQKWKGWNCPSLGCLKFRNWWIKIRWCTNFVVTSVTIFAHVFADYHKIKRIYLSSQLLFTLTFTFHPTTFSMRQWNIFFAHILVIIPTWINSEILFVNSWNMDETHCDLLYYLLQGFL